MVQTITAKSILNKTKRRDPWFLDDYTLNPYSGCSFNCLFCYIRGSKYGEHMEEKLSVKSNAVELLDKQLHQRAKKEQYGVIVLSSATDPYLHLEKETGLTRSLLEVILKYRFPVHIITRSDLVLRDLDLIRAIEQRALLPKDLQGQLSQKSFITFSFSTIDDAIAHVFEPGAPSPSLRVQTLQTVLKEGFLGGVSLMPLLPYISDTGEHLHEMFKTFSAIGVKYLFPSGLTLFGNGPSDSRTLVFRAVQKHYPHLLPRYEKLFTNSGGLPAYYQQAFHRKMEELLGRYQISGRIC